MKIFIVWRDSGMVFFKKERVGVGKIGKISSAKFIVFIVSVGFQIRQSFVQCLRLATGRRQINDALQPADG